MPIKRISSQLKWFEITMHDFWVNGILSPDICHLILLVRAMIRRLLNRNLYEMITSIKSWFWTDPANNVKT